MIEIPAFAKLNIGLRITRRRSNGYHELQSIFQSIDLKDCIRFEPADSLKLSVSGIPLPSDDSNLVMQAAKKIQIYAKGQGMHIHLHKNIPFGAGLGGGSSDATSTLVALNKLWNLQKSHDELAEIAFSLGADLPYFLHGGTQLAEGLGEELHQLNDFSAHFLLVFPDFAISTPWAYAQLRQQMHHVSPSADMVRALANEDWQELWNDFQRILKNTHPEIDIIVEKLMQTGAEHAALSGSGSTVFGIFQDPESAKVAAGQFKNARLCHSVPASEMHGGIA